MKLLIALDIILGHILFLSLKPITISARVGYAAYRGKAWGKLWAPVIDAVLGENHCLQAAHNEGLILG